MTSGAVNREKLEEKVKKLKAEKKAKQTDVPRTPSKVEESDESARVKGKSLDD